MLAQILAPYRPGDKPITVSYRNERFARRSDCRADWRVNLDDALIERLREWLSPENVKSSTEKNAHVPSSDYALRRHSASPVRRTCLTWSSGPLPQPRPARC